MQHVRPLPVVAMQCHVPQPAVAAWCVRCHLASIIVLAMRAVELRSMRKNSCAEFLK